jgi:hypothetical protein
VNGKTFFEIQENRTGGETCIIESKAVGNLSSGHDAKYETDTVQSFNATMLSQATKITVVKTVLRSDGSNAGTGTKRIYFKNKQDLTDYLISIDKTPCDLPD